MCILCTCTSSSIRTCSAISTETRWTCTSEATNSVHTGGTIHTVSSFHGTLIDVYIIEDNRYIANYYNNYMYGWSVGWESLSFHIYHHIWSCLVYMIILNYRQQWVYWRYITVHGDTCSYIICLCQYTGYKNLLQWSLYIAQSDFHYLSNCTNWFHEYLINKLQRNFGMAHVVNYLLIFRCVWIATTMHAKVFIGKLPATRWP